MVRVGEIVLFHMSENNVNPYMVCKKWFSQLRLKCFVVLAHLLVRYDNEVVFSGYHSGFCWEVLL